MAVDWKIYKKCDGRGTDITEPVGSLCGDGLVHVFNVSNTGNVYAIPMCGAEVKGEKKPGGKDQMCDSCSRCFLSGMTRIRNGKMEN
jgi:hypothetical protein